MTAPFPFFGGKTRAARFIWDRLGNVPNYVEPFAGSLATLLARPLGNQLRPDGQETVNDKVSGFGKGLYTLDNRERVPALLAELQQRLRYVRITNGEWDRVLTPAATYGACGSNSTITGILLDPPYPEGDVTYATGPFDPTPVYEWALANGDNPCLRIALCGYEGQQGLPPIPDTWACVAWKAKGGYGNLGDGQGRANSSRERVWFSPHCLKPQPGLFDYPMEPGMMHLTL